MIQQISRIITNRKTFHYSIKAEWLTTSVKEMKVGNNCRWFNILAIPRREETSQSSGEQSPYLLSIRAWYKAIAKRSNVNKSSSCRIKSGLQSKYTLTSLKEWRSRGRKRLKCMMQCWVPSLIGRSSISKIWLERRRLQRIAVGLVTIRPACKPCRQRWTTARRGRRRNARLQSKRRRTIGSSIRKSPSGRNWKSSCLIAISP